MRGIKYIYNYDGETEIKCKRTRNGGLGGKENGEGGEIKSPQLGTLKEAKTHSLRHNLIITALLVL